MVYVETDPPTLRLSRQVRRSVGSVHCVTVRQRGRVGGQRVKPRLREAKYTTVTVILSRLNQVNQFIKLTP